MRIGELMGRAVKAAVKEALRFQTGLSPAYQHQAVRRMERFGITNDLLWKYYAGGKSRAGFEECLEELLSRDMLVTYTSLYAHLMDQLMWGLISAQEAETAGEALRGLMGMEQADGETAQAFSLKECCPALPDDCRGEQSCIIRMAEAYGAGLERLV